MLLAHAVSLTQIMVRSRDRQDPRKPQTALSLSIARVALTYVLVGRYVRISSVYVCFCPSPENTKPTLPPNAGNDDRGSFPVLSRSLASFSFLCRLPRGSRSPFVSLSAVFETPHAQRKKRRTERTTVSLHVCIASYLDPYVVLCTGRRTCIEGRAGVGRLVRCLSAHGRKVETDLPLTRPPCKQRIERARQKRADG